MPRSKLDTKNGISLWTRFYVRLFVVLIPTILFGSWFPQIASQFEFWGIEPKISQRAVLLLDILVTLGVALWLTRSSWERFFHDRDAEYRPGVVSIIVFLFFFVILDSTLFLFIDTKIPLYQFFLDKHDYLNVARWTLLINSGIAITAALTMVTLNALYIRRYRNRLQISLWRSTFALTLIPAFIAFVPIIIFAERGYATYIFVALFPYVLAMLAILGYSHPGHRLENPWIARTLFITSIFACFFGFIMAMAGLMWQLSGEPEAPRLYCTFFNPNGYAIDWLTMPYSSQQYSFYWEQGFTWMVLTGVFFMELCLGLATVLTIYRYQILEKDDVGEGGSAVLSNGPSNSVVPEDQADSGHPSNNALQD